MKLLISHSWYSLVDGLSCVRAVASHVELHLIAVGPECILCGSRGELVDPSIPWNNFSPCLALLICPVHGWKYECSFET